MVKVGSVRYDFSLDVGQSMQSENQSKEKPSKEDHSDKKMQEGMQKPTEQEQKKEKDSEELKVKEISFEKAELLKEQAKAQEEKKEEDDDDDEDVDDVNDLLEDSFRKETENYVNNTKPKPKRKLNYTLAAAIIIILLGISFMGFYYKTPQKASIEPPVAAEETQLQQELPETTVIEEPEETNKSVQKKEMAGDTLNNFILELKD